MNIYGKTDPGLKRSQNQDVYKTCKISDNLSWIMVCDGMGGAKAGDVASRKAAEIIETELTSKLKEDITADDIKVIVNNAIEIANTEIYRLSCDTEDYRGMGTTVVISIVLNNKLYTAHVGDSRAYLWDGNSCKQITVDHSLVQALINAGKLDSESARLHPQKTIITKCLGVRESVRCDFSIYDFPTGDCVVLCSDGLGDYLNQESITEFFSYYQEEYVVEALIDFAMRCGGTDNISVAAIFNNK